MHLIGLTGPSGSRKTVAAKRLAKRYGFQRIHAGEPIKHGVQKGFNLSNSQVRGKRKDVPAPELGGASPRMVLEPFGTAVHLAAPRATSTILHKKVVRRLSRGKSVVVDGIRTGVEANAIRQMGGKVLRLYNGKEPNSDLPLDVKQASIQADHTIQHDGSKSDVRNKVDQYMMSLLNTPIYDRHRGEEEKE